MKFREVGQRNELNKRRANLNSLKEQAYQQKQADNDTEAMQFPGLQQSWGSWEFGKSVTSWRAQDTKCQSATRSPRHDLNSYTASPFLETPWDLLGQLKVNLLQLFSGTSRDGSCDSFPEMCPRMRTEILLHLSFLSINKKAASTNFCRAA